MSEQINLAGFHFGRMELLRRLCCEKNNQIRDLIEQEDFDSARMKAQSLAEQLARARDQSNFIADNYADLTKHQITDVMNRFLDKYSHEDD